MINPTVDNDRQSIEERILRTYRTIAIVGLSADPQRHSFQVSSYLQQHGYHIIPVNPRVKEVLGQPSYPNLSAVPVPVEVVAVFRRASEVPAIVAEAIRLGTPALWLQEGIVHEESARQARDAGMLVVMDRCLAKELRRLEQS